MGYDRFEQVVLGWEVTMHGSGAYACAAGDFVEADGGAFGGECLAGGVEDAVEVPDGVGT
jgi:hypothetical protein